MNALRMRSVQYTGQVWVDQSVHPDLWNLLQQKDLLIELSAGQPPYQVVLGVPHHAGRGVEQIATDWLNPKTGQPGRVADESAGLVGLAVFSALREKGLSCRLVIAAHPTDHDPNKTPGCPYWQSIFAPGPEDPLTEVQTLLLELHGAGRHRRHDLELSAGQNELSAPLAFGKVLSYFIDPAWTLAVQETPGARFANLFKNRQLACSARLQNPALETLSLAQAGQLCIPALHLEMKYPFRRPDPAYPAAARPCEAAWQLARALANTIALFSRTDDIHISAAALGLPSSAFLTRPALNYEDSYLSLVKETNLEDIAHNSEFRIWSHQAFAYLVEGTRKVIFDGLPGEPPEEYLWLIDQGEVIGRAYFLHWLNEQRLQEDGQVDYWIRPSKRGRGYGNLILRLLLERYRQLGQPRILITCLTTNQISRKVIEANGGVFESEREMPGYYGKTERRYRFWIDLQP